ncbi:hypothetical protein PAXRUDRAFT_14431 [Paxillus rubicundulus Ve08.2h10]|uniref:Uncharacterized protein n=1 Tax=Paxillus rubicundulus Ve08.2h10 TaxID=930991 RepID=A0A0D0CVW5_9AGAM|nr:hypothetical protein PAXRUDRAFT_14431 [Paxillus rubicundulus Ve08.2h10]
MSILTFLLSGAISIIIWFEIFHSYELSNKERVAFILTGIVESMLFLASILGFIGVVARKQLFVMIYTYFLYVHFVLNLIVGIYFLVSVRMSNRQHLVDYCAQVFVNTSTERDCTRLMDVSTYVYITIVAFLLLLELYGALIASRYVYRLRMQKRAIRSRRLGYFHALSVPEPATAMLTSQQSDNIELLHPRESTGSTFTYTDPYDLEGAVLDIRPQPSTSYTPLSTHDRDLPPLPKPSPPPSQRTISSDASSGRRVRALPPRPMPNATSQTVTSAPSWPPERTERQRRPPNSNPPTSYIHGSQEPASPESEDEWQSLYTAEVSTNAHSALMDHAAYMRTVFVPPSSARPVPRSPPYYTDSRQPDEEGQSSSKRQRSAIDESLFPWGPTSVAIQDTLAPEHQQVLNILDNWSNDPTFIVRKILLAPRAPDFPPDQWTNIIKGLAIDLNKIVGAHYSTDVETKQMKDIRDLFQLSIRTSKQSKIVWTHGDWVIAFGKTLQATVFALPQRSAEYTAWQTYISQLFASVQFSQHERVMEFDKAVRLCVANQKHIRLIDFAKFDDL